MNPQCQNYLKYIRHKNMDQQNNKQQQAQQKSKNQTQHNQMFQMQEQELEDDEDKYMPCQQFNPYYCSTTHSDIFMYELELELYRLTHSNSSNRLSSTKDDSQPKLIQFISRFSNRFLRNNIANHHHNAQYIKQQPIQLDANVRQAPLQIEQQLQIEPYQKPSIERQQQIPLQSVSRPSGQLQQFQSSIPCIYCGQPQKLSQLDSHPLRCQHWEEMCKGCSHKFPRSLMQQHQQICPSLAQMNRRPINQTRQRVVFRQSSGMRDQFEQDQYIPTVRQQSHNRSHPTNGNTINQNNQSKNSGGTIMSQISTMFKSLTSALSFSSKKTDSQAQAQSERQLQYMETLRERHRQRIIQHDRRVADVDDFGLERNQRVMLMQDRFRRRERRRERRRQNNTFDFMGILSRQILRSLSDDGSFQEEKGLTKQQISKFQVKKYKLKQKSPQNKSKDDQEEQMCVICFFCFQNNQAYMILTCNHIFHPQCIGPWLQKSPSCPLCKKKYGKGEQIIYQQDQNQQQIEMHEHQQGQRQANDNRLESNNQSKLSYEIVQNQDSQDTPSPRKFFNQ